MKVIDIYVSPVDPNNPKIEIQTGGSIHILPLSEAKRFVTELLTKIGDFEAEVNKIPSLKMLPQDIRQNYEAGHWIKVTEESVTNLIDIVELAFDNGTRCTGFWSSLNNHWDIGPEQYPLKRITHYKKLCPGPNDNNSNKNLLITIGYNGDKTAYLNISKETAIKHWLKDNPGYIDDLKDILGVE